MTGGSAQNSAEGKVQELATFDGHVEEKEWKKRERCNGSLTKEGGCFMRDGVMIQYSKLEEGSFCLGYV